MSRRFAPWRGVDSPPGQELLGVITSHGPYRESYRSAQKASGWATDAIRASAAAAVLPAQRVQATFSSPSGGPALLQRGLPEGGAEMVAVEGPATIPKTGGGATETQRSKPALSRARQKPKNARVGSS